MVTIDDKKLEQLLCGLRISLKNTLDVEEVAFLLNKDEQTIRRWCKLNKIPHHRTDDGYLRFDKNEIDRYRLGSIYVPTINEMTATAETYCMTKR